MNETPSGASRVDQVDRAAGRCDGGAGRDSSSAAPTAVSPAAARNAAGIPLPAATSPSNMGPPPRPRSMNTLAVPAALPRSEGGNRGKIAPDTPRGGDAKPTPRTPAAAGKPPAAGTPAAGGHPTPPGAGGP